MSTDISNFFRTVKRRLSGNFDLEQHNFYSLSERIIVFYPEESGICLTRAALETLAEHHAHRALLLDFDGCLRRGQNLVALSHQLGLDLIEFSSPVSGSGLLPLDACVHACIAIQRWLAADIKHVAVLLASQQSSRLLGSCVSYSSNESGDASSFSKCIKRFDAAVARSVFSPKPPKLPSEIRFLTDFHHVWARGRVNPPEPPRLQLAHITINYLPQFETLGCQLLLQVHNQQKFVYSSWHAPGGLKWLKADRDSSLHVCIPVNVNVLGECNIEAYHLATSQQQPRKCIFKLRVHTMHCDKHERQVVFSKSEIDQSVDDNVFDDKFLVTLQFAEAAIASEVEESDSDELEQSDAESVADDFGDDSGNEFEEPGLDVNSDIDSDSGLDSLEEVSSDEAMARALQSQFDNELPISLADEQFARRLQLQESSAISNGLYAMAAAIPRSARSSSIRDIHRMLDNDALDYETRLMLEQQLSDGIPPRNAADVSQINALPQHVCTISNQQCMVCLEGMKKRQIVRTLPCFHVFHTRCVDQWLLQNKACPICKLNIDQL